MKLYKPERTPGQSIVETIMFAVLSLFIYYVIIGIFKVLFWPVRYLFMTDDQIYNEEKRQAKEKIKNRDRMLAEFRSRPDNPIGDPRYAEWFKAWREGKTLDSRLLWAPDVYINMRPVGRRFNPTFLSYLEIQVNLHKNAGWVNKALFKGTIWRYYPEFTPDLDKIPEEIQAIRDRLKIKELTDSLTKELKKLGMHDVTIQRILSKNPSPEELAKKVENIRLGLARGFSQGAAITIDDMGISTDTDEAAEINKLIKETNAPSFVTVAYIKGEIDKQSLDYLCLRYQDRLEREGMSLDTLNFMVMLLDEEKKESAPRLKKAYMERTYGKPVWE